MNNNTSYNCFSLIFFEVSRPKLEIKINFPDCQKFFNVSSEELVARRNKTPRMSLIICTY